MQDIPTDVPGGQIGYDGKVVSLENYTAWKSFVEARAKAVTVPIDWNSISKLDLKPGESFTFTDSSQTLGGYDIALPTLPGTGITIPHTHTSFKVTAPKTSKHLSTPLKIPGSTPPPTPATDS